jgi:hypothetical protein
MDCQYEGHFKSKGLGIIEVGVRDLSVDKSYEI